MFEISKFNSTSPRARTYELIRAFSGKRELGSRYQKTPPGVFRQIVFSGNVNLFHGIKRPPHFFSGTTRNAGQETTNRNHTGNATAKTDGPPSQATTTQAAPSGPRGSEVFLRVNLFHGIKSR